MSERYVRLLVDGEPRWALVDGSQAHLLEGAPYEGAARRGATVDLAGAVWLAPATPSKIVAVGRNYADHARELNLEVAEQPRVFLKPPSALVGHEVPVVHPTVSQEVHHEAELALVIGRQCKGVSPEEAAEAVFGVTCANDVTARDIQRVDGQPTYAKSFDTFCPLGPWLVPGVDTGSLTVECLVNGQRRQRGSTADLIHDVPTLVAYVARAMTLLPGDVILTGTPAGVSAVAPGDLMEVTIEGIGTLRNPVVSE